MNIQEYATLHNINIDNINYILSAYPLSHFDNETNTLIIKGKKCEALSYFLTTDTDLITIDQLLDIAKTYSNITSMQTVRNYITANLLPKPVLYIGRFSFFNKSQLIKFLKDTYE